METVTTKAGRGKQTKCSVNPAAGINFNCSTCNKKVRDDSSCGELQCVNACYDELQARWNVVLSANHAA